MGLSAVFAVCAVVAAWRLKYLGWKRFIPLAAILALWFPFALILPRIPGLRVFLPVFLPFLGFALVFYTLRLTWSGTHWTERVLRILSGAFLLVVIWILFSATIP